MPKQLLKAPVDLFFQSLVEMLEHDEGVEAKMAEYNPSNHLSDVTTLRVKTPNTKVSLMHQASEQKFDLFVHNEGTNVPTTLLTIHEDIVLKFPFTKTNEGPIDDYMNGVSMMYLYILHSFHIIDPEYLYPEILKEAIHEQEDPKNR